MDLKSSCPIPVYRPQAQFIPYACNAHPQAAPRPPQPAQREPPLVLDGTTLANLEVFQNSYDRSAKGG